MRKGRSRTGVVLEDETIRALQGAVDEYGPDAVAGMVGVSRPVLANACAGWGVMPTTGMVLEAWVGEHAA